MRACVCVCVCVCTRARLKQIPLHFTQAYSSSVQKVVVLCIQIVVAAISKLSVDLLTLHKVAMQRAHHENRSPLHFWQPVEKVK